MKPDQPATRKISFPTLPSIVPRKRLFQKLDRRGHYGVTWITGMAGSGKTTLAAGYLATLHIPCLWFAMDEGDEDLATFFYYLGLAGQEAVPFEAPPLPFLTPEYLQNVTTFSRRYFEALCKGLPRPFFLVFDDYHKIPTESRFHGPFRDGISVVPHDIHILILSRSNPPAPFIRMLANNRIRLVGQKDLKLNITESRKVAAIAFGRRVPEKLMGEISQRVQGWAAGLILMTKSLKSGNLPPETLNTFTPKEVFFYFAEEVFGNMETTTKEFLIKSSPLPRMTTAMAKELTGQADAPSLLATLERDHLFMERFPSRESVYQFHPLFREFLLSKAAETLPQKAFKQLQRKAATLLHASGYFEEAADLYIQAEDTSGLMGLVEEQARGLLDQGRHGTLQQWIKHLPEETLQKTPWALYWLGLSCQHVAPAEARARFETAFRLFEAAKERRGVFLAWTGIVGTTLYEWNNFAILNPWIDRMEGDLLAEESFPSPEIETAVAVSMMSALMCCRPHHPHMTMWIEKALSLSRQHGDLRLRIEAADWTITYFSWIGDFARADIIKREIGRLMGAYKAHLPGMLHWKWLDISTRLFYDIPDVSTLQEVIEALETIEQTGIGAWEQMFLLNGVFVALILGHFQRAEGFLQRLQPILNPSRYHGYGIFHHCAALYNFLRGDTIRALEHARTALKAINETGYVFPVMVCRYGLAMVLIDQERFEEAAEELSSAHSLARKTRSTIAEFMCLLGNAWLAFRQKRDEDPAYLKEAMSFGRRHAFQSLIWWWHPDMLSRLCARALEEGIEVDYCRRLIRAWNLTLENPPYDLKGWPWTLEIHTFGRFGILKDGTPLRFAGRSQKRPLELLRALISRGGIEVDIEKIMDDLWPDTEGDMAHSAFSTNLNRLRTILAHKETIQLRDGRLTLNPRYCWIDTWVFEFFLEEAETLWKQGKRKKAMAKYEEALSLYKGPFISEEPLQHWAVVLRERMSLRYLKALITLGSALEEEGEYEEAIQRYESGLEGNNLEEVFYQRLILCHARLGRHADVVKTYRRCRDTLARTLEVPPSEETERMYRRQMASRARNTEA